MTEQDGTELAQEVAAALAREQQEERAEQDAAIRREMETNERLVTALAESGRHDPPRPPRS